MVLKRAARNIWEWVQGEGIRGGWRVKGRVDRCHCDRLEPTQFRVPCRLDTIESRETDYEGTSSLAEICGQCAG